MGEQNRFYSKVSSTASLKCNMLSSYVLNLQTKLSTKFLSTEILLINAIVLLVFTSIALIPNCLFSLNIVYRIFNRLPSFPVVALTHSINYSHVETKRKGKLFSEVILFMKNLILPKVLLIASVCVGIFLFVSASEIGLRLGIALMFVPIIFLLYSISRYGFSVPKEDLEGTEDSLAVKQEIAMAIHEKTSVDNVKSNPELLKANNPFQANFSTDPTLHNG